MDRAGNVLRKLGLPGACVSAEELARAAWPQAVGKRIAAHTRPVAFADGCLTIEVEDTVWLQHLRTMRRHILPRVQAIAGKDVLKALDFRPGVPRREPQRAEGRGAQTDEADGIQDPILRRVYKASRSRSA
jgi:predicted nucleic acid-binding Zn ribbon protein